MHFDWRTYFVFTTKEQKGILVLGGILSFSLLLHFILPSKSVQFSETKNKPSALFYFDPNRLDSVKGLQLGLSKKQMLTLYHYREKGGRFYTKYDLLKWYGLSESQAILLMPWVRIQHRDTLSFKWQSAQVDASNRTEVKIDINNPNASEWIQLTGLPAYKVKRILTYQKWTGGFTSIQGLKKVHGITAFDFKMIFPYLQYQPKRTHKMSYQSMRFEDWMSLGIFDEKSVRAILNKINVQKGKLTWTEMVIQFDLTEKEADLLKVEPI